MVEDDNRVTEPAGLTDAAEAAPDRCDVARTLDGVASRLVENLVALVDDLDVLRRADLAVRVRRGAVAGDARVGNPVEVQDRRGHVRPSELVLHDPVGPRTACRGDRRGVG